MGDANFVIPARFRNQSTMFCFGNAGRGIIYFGQWRFVDVCEFSFTLVSIASELASGDG